jgi:hypothetical protein
MSEISRKTVEEEMLPALGLMNKRFDNKDTTYRRDKREEHGRNRKQ